MESMEKTRTTLSLMPPLLGHDGQLFFVILSKTSTGESARKKKIASCAFVSLYMKGLSGTRKAATAFCSALHGTMTDKLGVEDLK